MNRVVKIAVYLAGGLALNAGSYADGVVLPGNPYALIVTRNIFGLNPPALVEPPPIEPPAKITPNGIMAISGNLKVLFKVSGAAKPGQPPTDDSYILSVGQRQNDIEVTHIDEKKGLVTFNNHSVVQELALAVAPAITAPVTAPAPVPGVNPAMPAVMPNYNNGGNRSDNRGGNFGGRGGNRGSGNGGNNPGMGEGASLRNIPTRNSDLGPSQNLPKLTPEVQVIMIEANRMDTQPAVDAGMMPPLPPTPLTPPDATAVGGSPLIAPPPIPGG